ncbi:MAG: pentapeptide repeat-containing protein [Planctomycetota bacterium]
MEPVPLVDWGTFLVTLVGVTVTVVGFCMVWSQLDEQKVSQAWQTLVGAAGKRGEAGRVRALERLTKSRQHLTSTDLSSGLYQQAEFSSGAFDQANFDGATLREVRFLGSNLFKVTFRGATVTGSLFAKCNFSNADFGGSAEIIDTVFTAVAGSITADNAGGEQVVFRGSRLRKVVFRGVSLSGADFRDVVGTNVSFSDCNLHGSRFNKAQLFAQFEDVRANQATIFAGAVLEGTRFSNSELRSCDFSSANLRGATFAKTTMSAIRFMGADLRGAHFNMPGAVDGNDWDGYIQSIRLANIAGIDAPKGFHEWAISRGAVDEPSTDGWEALRKKEGLQPMYERSGALKGLGEGTK